MFRANDLRQFRIDFVLQEMQDMKLCHLPDDEAWPVEYFTEQTQVSCPIQYCTMGRTLFSKDYVIALVPVQYIVQYMYSCALQVSTARCAHMLHIKSVSVEDSVNELIDLLCGEPAPADAPAAAADDAAAAAQGEEGAQEGDGRTTESGSTPGPGPGAAGAAPEMHFYSRTLNYSFSYSTRYT